MKLGFGTSQLGGQTIFAKKQVGMGPQKKSDSLKAIKKALINGINFFDTADIYGNGKVEKILGETLSSKRNVVICTKYGNRFYNKKYLFDISSNYLIESVENSLKRLRKTYIDILLLHSPPNNILMTKNYISTLNHLKEKNKIKTFGISCKSIESAKNFINKYDFIDYIEIIYNICDRRAENTLFKICSKKNIKIIARIPLVSGFLSLQNLNKKYRNDDSRKYVDKDFKEWIKKFHLKSKFLSQHSNNMISNALRFCFTNKSISVVIPGMRNVKQVNCNYKSFIKGPLSAKMVKKISKLPKFYPGWNV